MPSIATTIPNAWGAHFARKCSTTAANSDGLRVPMKKKERPMAKIKFISYDGAYPVLCSGKLTVEIDGKTITFGQTKYYPGLNNKEDLAHA